MFKKVVPTGSIALLQLLVQWVVNKIQTLFFSVKIVYLLKHINLSFFQNSGNVLQPYY